MCIKLPKTKQRNDRSKEFDHMFSIPKNNNILEFIGICNELPKSELEKKDGPKIIGSSVLKEYETNLLGTPFCLPKYLPFLLLFLCVLSLHTFNLYFCTFVFMHRGKRYVCVTMKLYRGV